MNIEGKSVQAAFASYLGALAVPIVVLMVMMIIDYLSGMERGNAVKQGWRKGHCEKSRVHGADRGRYGSRLPDLQRTLLSRG